MVSAPLPSRRAVIVGGLGAAALAACGGSSDDTGVADGPAAAASPAADEVAGTFLAPGFPDGLRAPAMLVPGVAQLVPIFLAADTGRPLQADETPSQLAVRILSDAGDVIDEQLLDARGDGIPSPHYSVLVDLDAAGTYAMAAEVGGEEQSFAFAVGERDEIGLVQVGDALRPLDTPTVSDARGVDPICTRLPEPCPFHDLTVTEAVAADRPVILLIATPAFCQTVICGPVVDLLIEAAAARDDLSVVHAEVWRNAEAVFTPDGATPVIETYALGYEPSLYVADGSGVVTARLDLAWDRTELDAALATLA